jgi:osmotically-inducible protein OsmY
MKDKLLRQNVLDELDYEPSIDAAHIGVAAENGVVTLSGHVRSYAEKLTAKEATLRINGVKAVADEIEVRFPDGIKSADDEIAKRAVAILAWDTQVPPEAIKVAVREGFVELRGTVDWNYQREAAEGAVRKLSHIRGVVNNITLTPRANVADIKEKIENALKRNAAAEARAIRVTVEGGGSVRLEGKVDNWRERMAVKAAAWSAPGVRSVIDELAIA